MGALGKELRGGEQGDRVGGLVLEGGAGHLRSHGRARIQCPTKGIGINDDMGCLSAEVHASAMMA